MTRSRFGGQMAALVAFSIGLVLIACGDDEPVGSTTMSDDGGAQTGRDARVAMTADAGGQAITDASTSDGDAGAIDAGPSMGSDSAVDRPEPEDPVPLPPEGMGPNGTMGLCYSEPPAGVEMPAPLPTYSGGACPDIVPGRNQIMSGGAMREFLFVAPEWHESTAELPLMFLWHWLGGSASSFLERGEIQDAANRKGFLAVIPEEKGDLQLRWPFNVIDPEPRVEEELTFFDDMLACVAEQYGVIPHCVGSAGVSAGALFTSVLAGRRSERLSSIISLSGGTGGLLLKPWTEPAHKMPAVVLWGGPMDSCIVINFEESSHELERNLDQGGHFTIECVHNCRHAAPPLSPPMDEPTFGMLFDFLIDHPYWLADGQSPYSATGLPPSMPEWCAISSGQAQIRTGMCPPPSC